VRRFLFLGKEKEERLNAETLRAQSRGRESDGADAGRQDAGATLAYNLNDHGTDSGADAGGGAVV